MIGKKVLGAFLLVLMAFCAFLPFWKLMHSRSSDSMITSQAEELGATERAWAERARVKDAGPDKLEELAKGNGIPQFVAKSESLTGPAPTATLAPEPAPPVMDCTQDDVLFRRKGCSTADLMERTPPVPKHPDGRIMRYQPVVEDAPSMATPSRGTTPPSLGKAAPPSTGRAVSSEGAHLLAGVGLTEAPRYVEGMSRSYPGAVIRAGCYLITEMVEDQLIVVQGTEHMVTLDVKGAMPGCKLPNVWPIRLVALVSLNSPGTRIVGNVKTCTGGESDQKSIECKARIKDFTGADGLAGVIYDDSMWGVVVDMALALGTAPTIANLTKEVAGAKNYWSGAASQEIAGTLQRSVQRVSEKINKALEGREIRLKKYYVDGKPVGPFVMVAFEADAFI